jgi:hypothetical protein
MLRGWRIISIFFLLFSICAILSLEAAGVERMNLAELLPQKILGWSSVGEDRIFDRNSIFDYLDGGGEIYLAYDFQKLLVREYQRAQESPIVAEVYEMSSAEDAYGIFTHDTDGEGIDLGQGALYGMGLLRFWKGRIFIRVMADRETIETKNVVMAIGEQIAEAIQEVGKKPKLISLLSEEGLIPKSVHYFHKQVSLNNHYYLGDSNLLNLGNETEAVLAQYKRGGQKVRLLLCLYKGPKEAEAGFRQFTNAYFSAKQTTENKIQVETTKNGKFASAFFTEGLLVLVFESPDKKTCESLTDKVIKRKEEAL